MRPLPPPFDSNDSFACLPNPTTAQALRVLNGAEGGSGGKKNRKKKGGQAQPNGASGKAWIDGVDRWAGLVFHPRDQPVISHHLPALFFPFNVYSLSVGCFCCVPCVLAASARVSANFSRCGRAAVKYNCE